MNEGEASRQLQNLDNLCERLSDRYSQELKKITTLQTEKKAIKTQLDGIDTLEAESAALSVSAGAQLKDTASLLGSLLGERVAPLKGEMDDLALRLQNKNLALGGERYRLKCEADERERKLREEFRVLKLDAEKVFDEMTQTKTAMQELIKETDSAISNSLESENAMNRLKGDFARAIAEKAEIENLHNAQLATASDLELELSRIDESLKVSRNENKLLSNKIQELENSAGLAIKKEKELVREKSALVSEKKEMEKSVEVLTEETDTVQRDLDMHQGELEDERRKIDEANRARDEIEQQVKVREEHDIPELQGQVDRWKGDVDNMRKELEEEKNKAKKLELQIAGLEGKLGKSEAELGQMRTQREKLNVENKELKRNVADLMKEKEALQNTLTMLKNTAALVSHEDGSEEAVQEETKLEEEIVPCAEELGAIRNAFKSKKEVVDDLKLQIVSLQRNVDAARKDKGFLWTMISSATALFAPVLAAYLARRR